MQRVNDKKWKRQINYLILFSSFIYYLGIKISGGLWSNLGFIILDVCLFSLCILIFLFLFSQFIFPLDSKQERRSAFNRLILFILGQHGPILTVRKGLLKQINFNHKTNKPGVIQLDSSSSALICNESGLSCVLQPGIYFSKNNERIVNAVDLHVQERRIGPNDNENPFRTKRRTEGKKWFRENIDLGKQTLGLTRDGIAIIPSFLYSFKLTSSPNSGNSLYGFNPLSVKRTLVDELNYHGSSENTISPYKWDQLPGQLLVELWREAILKFSFSEIFCEKSKELLNILDHMRARLTQNEVDEFIPDNAFGRKKIKSKEFQLLQKKGVSFLNFHLLQLWFPPEIEAELAINNKKEFVNIHDEIGDADNLFENAYRGSSVSDDLLFKIVHDINEMKNYEDITPARIVIMINNNYPKLFNK